MVHCYTQLRNFPKGKRTKAGGVDRTAHSQFWLSATAFHVALSP